MMNASDRASRSELNPRATVFTPTINFNDDPIRTTGNNVADPAVPEPNPKGEEEPPEDRLLFLQELLKTERMIFQEAQDRGRLRVVLLEHTQPSIGMWCGRRLRLLAHDAYKQQWKVRRDVQGLIARCAESRGESEAAPVLVHAADELEAEGVTTLTITAALRTGPARPAETIIRSLCGLLVAKWNRQLFLNSARVAAFQLYHSIQREISVPDYCKLFRDLVEDAASNTKDLSLSILIDATISTIRDPNFLSIINLLRKIATDAREGSLNGLTFKYLILTADQTIGRPNVETIVNCW
jgi:hypothetical protein